MYTCPEYWQTGGPIRLLHCYQGLRTEDVFSIILQLLKPEIASQYN